MDFQEFLTYFNYALKIIFVVLFLYCVYVGYVFFSALQHSYDSEEQVLARCNAYAVSEQFTQYCCVKQEVFVNGNAIDATCFSLYSARLIDGLSELSCAAASCYVS